MFLLTRIMPFSAVWVEETCGRRMRGRPNKGFGRTATGACAVAAPSLPTRIFRDAKRGGRGNVRPRNSWSA
jgi:hypothetical protein